MWVLGLSDRAVGCSHMVRCECWVWLFDMIIGLVPTWSYVSASPSDMHARLVPRMCRCKCRALLNMYVGLVPHMCWMEVQILFDMNGGLVPLMARCECWAFLIGLWDVFPHGQMWVLGVPFWYDYRIGSYMIKYNCWVSHSDLGSDISAEEDLHGG